MLLELHIFCIGAAAVVDTALLLSVLERRNWMQVPLSIVALISGAWLFHLGEFANLLLADTPGPWGEAARWLAMSVISAGLLLMPSSMFHGLLRIWRTGFELRVRPRRTYGFAYVPLLVLPLAMWSLAARPGLPYLERVALYVSPYVAFTGAVNITGLVTFWRHCRSTDNHALRGFLTWMCCILAVLTVLLGVCFWILDAKWIETGSPLLLAVILSPLAPALLFAYFVIRYRFMRLVAERTLVYGVMLAGALLFHRLVVQDVTEQLGQRFRIDFGVLEGVVVFLLVVLYQPMRQRVAEALRYLMGRSPLNIRQRTRELAVAMWQHVDDDAQTRVDWFVREIKDSLEVDWAASSLFTQTGEAFVQSRVATAISDADLAALHAAIQSHTFVSCHGPELNQPAVDVLQSVDGSLAIRVDHEGVSGLLALGRRRGASELGDEETNAVVLLVELLAVTLRNYYLQEQRLLAERHAAQNEKLSTLGLLTSCITHEIKNPLSSIKTIATVLSEQLDPASEHAEDVRLILDEADRLSNTTSQFLKFARPASEIEGATSLGTIIDGSLHVLGHLARRQNVTIEASIDPELPMLNVDENRLREVIFNLVLNSVEAAGDGGSVGIAASQRDECLAVRITDTGPGISTEMKGRIFEPFITSKPSGTGLGLYIVKRNVEQLGGSIDCDSASGRGTCFTLRLPCGVEEGRPGEERERGDATAKA